MLSIGELARQTGCTAPTIRYFEQIGLLPQAVRTAGNQRRYGPAHVSRLRFIRHGRALGFSQDDVRELLELAGEPGQPCANADGIARRHLDGVEARIAQLEALGGELKRMIHDDHHGTIADCRVIDVLADHGQCVSEHGTSQTGPGKGTP